MLPVVEMFCSIQGEGKFAGTPSFFIRTSGCNLRCVFRNSVCDTQYTSFHPEKSKYKSNKEIVDDFIKMQLKNPEVKHIVITGGEPLLHSRELRLFLGELADTMERKRIGEEPLRAMTITIETNGTIPPLDIPDNEDRYEIALYSVSPKLSTSVDDTLRYLNKEQAEHHDKTRINFEALNSFFEKPFQEHKLQFKFVYSNADSVTEIKQLYSSIINKKYEQIKEYFGNTGTAESWRKLTWKCLNEITMLMPEGQTGEQLSKVRKECAETCIENGWNYAERLHIIIWGDKRGV